MMLISECVKKFLKIHTHSDLAELYHVGMELQTIVHKGDGEKIEGDFKGRYDSFSNGVQTWYPIRLPSKDKEGNIVHDKEIHYDLEQYALGIGMSGWDYINKRSVWLGYDFDSIIGHSERHNKKLTDIELKHIQESLEQLPYVTIRQSTSGNGLHLYVFVNKGNINTRTEHAALARYVLGKLSAETGQDFSQKIDAYGMILWQWHQKMYDLNDNIIGLRLIKKGGVLHDIPDTWKEHISVISGKRKKATPFFINEHILDNPETEVDEQEDLFSEITGQRAKIAFDIGHRKLIQWLNENNYHCSYNQDHHLICTHTYGLKRAHEELALKGIFETIAEGREQGDLNCFMFPLKHSAWVVKRFTPGVAESPSWLQDPAGYTSCYYNRDPDLKTAANTYGGMENESGSFVFNTAGEAQEAAVMLGADLEIPQWALMKKSELKRHKDGRLVAKIEYDPNVDSRFGGLKGWQVDKKKMWVKILSTRLQEPIENETVNFDNIIRHLISPLGNDAGWAINTNGKDWHIEPIGHIQKALANLGYNDKDTKAILGGCVFKAWKLVNIPFQVEYLGDRQWNRNAAQLKYAPLKEKENLQYPTWIRLLTHLGQSLNSALKDNKWATDNNVTTGYHYLKLWIASAFQYPQEHLPYLFFYGQEQKTGKSSFHQALGLLMTNGVVIANHAIESQANFNGELENAIICAIEELNLRQDKKAFNKIKNWVTHDKITIRKMHTDAYDMLNFTKWIHTSNDYDAAPVFGKDTRITVIHVNAIPEEEFINRKTFFQLLEKEAQAFITEIMSIEIPPLDNDRLNIPVIATEDKIQLQEYNKTSLERFIAEKCYEVDGSMIKFQEFYNKFQEWLDPSETNEWTKIKVSRGLPPQHPSGHVASEANQVYVANISWEEPETNGHKRIRLIKKKDNLVLSGVV